MSATDGLSDSAAYIGYRVEWFMAFFIPLQIIAVALRLFSRWLGQHPYGMDDAIVLFSLVLQLTMAGIGIAAVKHGGMGYHIEYLEETDPAMIITWSKYLVAISTLYFFMVNIPKLAILALYYRLFPGQKTRIAIWTLVVILCGASFITTVIALAACKPYAANWDTSIPGYKCINKEPLFIWSSIPNIVTDVAMLILPQPIIWKLQTNTRMKVGLALTFLVGSFGLVTSVLRFDTFFRNDSFTDGSWNAVDLMIWTETEPGVYLISACLSTYRPLLEAMGFGKLTSNLSGRSKSKQSAKNSYGMNSMSKEHSSSTSRIYPGVRGSFQKIDDANSTDGQHHEETGEIITVQTDIQVDNQHGGFDSRR